MKLLTMDDVLTVPEYNQQRDEQRRRVIQLKAKRRLALGREVSVVFENRLTVLHQVQEHLRAERLSNPEDIARELETYNGLLPGDGSVAATLFIEPQDPARISEELERFKGIDRGEHLWFDLAEGERVVAHFERPVEPKARFRSIHYVQFHFAPSGKELLADSKRDIALVLDHPALQAKAPLSDEIRGELLTDLED